MEFYDGRYGYEYEVVITETVIKPLHSDTYYYGDVVCNVVVSAATY